MYEWIFDGIGTELIGLVLGLLIGGVSGYNIGIRSKSKQKQKAGDGASQQQTYIIGMCPKDTTLNSKVVQSQVAGNNTTQVQTGGTQNE